MSALISPCSNNLENFSLSFLIKDEEEKPFCMLLSGKEASVSTLRMKAYGLIMKMILSQAFQAVREPSIDTTRAH